MYIRYDSYGENSYKLYSILLSGTTNRIEHRLEYKYHDMTKAELFNQIYCNNGKLVSHSVTDERMLIKMCYCVSESILTSTHIIFKP